MKADRLEIRLPRRLDRLTDPDRALARIGQMAPLRGGVWLITLHGREEGPLWILKPRWRRPRPIGRFETVRAIFPSGRDAAMVASGDALWTVRADGRRRKWIDLPKGLVSVDVQWRRKGTVVAALVDRTRRPEAEAPSVYPAPRGEMTLCRYTRREGWVDLTPVSAGCSGLSLSGDGDRMVWREPVSLIPEEAQRAEFRGFDVSEKRILALTDGAGKAGKALVAPDGSGLIYSANHETDYPITTHTDVWWLTWGGGERRNLTGGGRCIEDFGWGPRRNSVWISYTDGLNRSTEVLHIGDSGREVLAPAATSPVAWTEEGRPAHETEDQVRLPGIWVKDRRVGIPQVEAFEDLRLATVQWSAPDGLELHGVVYEATGTPGDAPLLVKAHGGPAGTVAALRSEAVRYQYLLRAGYRVFNPAFRGSLGFGDAFARGNIGCQGEADLDDILSGIDHLVALGRASAGRAGIFGGSYGGYMTLRALAVTDRFRAGVSLYGFVSNRWMTLETGDFTYEREYVGPLSWPPDEASVRSDVFDRLGSIDAPLLLMHGDRDPICSLSQSVVTYRALEARGVEAGLVIYPGEGHGFRKKKNLQDCARRTLAWFLEHLPP